MKHAELIARLEAAEVGSRELDAEIWAASVGYVLVSFDGAGWLYKMHPNDMQRHERTGYIPPYTTSLDAALVLAERVLPPETMWELNRKCIIDGKKFYLCEFDVPEWGPRVDTYGCARTPALALCIAILRAPDNK